MVIGRDAPHFKIVNNRVMVDGEAVFCFMRKPVTHIDNWFLRDNVNEYVR